jgi:hypothetical protein
MMMMMMMMMIIIIIIIIHCKVAAKSLQSRRKVSKSAKHVPGHVMFAGCATNGRCDDLIE